MALSASRLLYLAFALFFGALAFVPRAKAALWLDLALAPTRVLGELASPVGMFARREARAAEETLANATEGESAESRKLADDERMFALPDEESLISERRFVHAQVVQRPAGAPDRVECELETGVGPEIVPGLPVVLSNSYVGRVTRVDAARRRIIVELVTDKEFRVGASCAALAPGETSPAMVVGGIESTREPDTPLSLHNPSTTRGLVGLVRVDESRNPLERYGT
ncbi:MAG TPA: hypothetical protein VM509_00825, partial [Planctomycetota bacterium]|nr:hypothetical protein [Planctomycetota bacterium]